MMSANDPAETEAAAIPAYREESAELECRMMGSDKVYNIQLTQSEAGWDVTAQHGPRNGTMTRLRPISGQPYEKAKKFFDTTIKAKLKGKDGKNYSLIAGTSDPGNIIGNASRTDDAPTIGAAAIASIPKLTSSRGPISADVVFAPELLTRVTKAEAVKFASDPRYVFQTKQDGDRLTVRVQARDSSEPQIPGFHFTTAAGAALNIYGYNKSGQVVALDAQLHSAIKRLCETSHIDRLLLDGEWEADGFHAWELLELHLDNPAWVGEGDLRELPYYQRQDMLEALLGNLLPDLAAMLHVTYTARDTAAKLALLADLKLEGVAIKLRAAPFRPGRNGQHKKYKHEQFASFIVGPKPRHKANDGHRSVALYIFDPTAKWTSEWQLADSGIPGVMPHALRYVSTVKIADKYDVPPVGSVIDVRYLYAYPAGGIAQPSYFGKLRSDVPHKDCSTAQLKFKHSAADDDDEEGGTN
jgi:bifunctional non-homologous end joining protein LigD